MEKSELQRIIREEIENYKKPTVEIKRGKESPYGGKTFFFVDPIYVQLKYIDKKYAEKYYKEVKGGWMDYNTCLDKTLEMVNIKLVDEYSTEVANILSKLYPNMPFPNKTN